MSEPDPIDELTHLAEEIAQEVRDELGGGN